LDLELGREDQNETETETETETSFITDMAMDIVAGAAVPTLTATETTVKEIVIEIESGRRSA